MIDQITLLIPIILVAWKDRNITAVEFLDFFRSGVSVPVGIRDEIEQSLLVHKEDNLAVLIKVSDAS